MPGRKKTLFLFSFLVLFLGSCTRRSGNYLADGNVPITVEPVTIELKETKLTFPVKIVINDVAKIQIPRSIKISRVFVNLGDPVATEAPLFELSEEDLSIKIAEQKILQNEQEALLEKNNYFLKNRDRLLQEGKIDQSQHEGLESEVKEGEAKIEKMKHEISELDRQLTKLIVASPIDGMVIEKKVTEGSIASADETLMTIARIDPIYATFQMSPEESGLISRDMNLGVQIEELGNKEVLGTVSFISPTLDPETKKFEVWVQLPNVERVLKEGMTGVVRFTGTQQVRTIFIPQEALLEEMGRQYVYAVRNNRAIRVRVYTEPTETHLIEISNGLIETDQVIVRGKENLKNGVLVEEWK